MTKIIKISLLDRSLKADTKATRNCSILDEISWIRSRGNANVLKRTCVPRKLRIHDKSLKAYNSERGNVFFIVMIGIALFAALSFTATRSSNTKSTGLLSNKQADLAASELMGYAQNVSRGVSRLIAKDCSENQISFEPPPFDGSTSYDNSNAPGDLSCHVFSTAGGAVTYRTLPAEWRAGGASALTPVITASSCIPAIGTGDDGTCLGNNDPNESEILFIAPDLSPTICERINLALNTPTTTVSITADDTEFDGTFLDIKTTGTDETGLNTNYSGVDSACWNDSTTNTYYKVLLAR